MLKIMCRGKEKANKQQHREMNNKWYKRKTAKAMIAQSQEESWHMGRLPSEMLVRKNLAFEMNFRQLPIRELPVRTNCPKCLGRLE